MFEGLVAVTLTPGARLIEEEGRSLFEIRVPKLVLSACLVVEPKMIGIADTTCPEDETSTPAGGALDVPIGIGET